MMLDAVRSYVAAGIEVVLPLTCAGCHAPAVRWCERCEEHLEDCPRRTELRSELMTPRGIVDCWAAASYTGPIKELLVGAKEHSRRDMHPRIGDLLYHTIRHLLEWDELAPSPMVLIPAPSRWLSASQRGGDPVAAYARRACERLQHDEGVPTKVLEVMRTRWYSRDSAGLSARERATNLRDAVVIRKRATATVDRLAAMTGVSVVVVDDVVTTGATLAQSISVLGKYGVEVTVAVVVAAA